MSIFKFYFILFLSIEETKDEPFAWEAREFLRKKLIGQEVTAVVEKSPNTTTGTRDYGYILLGKGNSVIKHFYLFYMVVSTIFF